MSMANFLLRHTVSAVNAQTWLNGCPPWYNTSKNFHKPIELCHFLWYIYIDFI